MPAQRPDRRPLAAVVVNGARASRVDGLYRRIAAAADAGGWGAPLLLTTTPQDAGSGLTSQALQAGASLVLAVGGDGTVRACAQALARSNVPLAIVPIGAGNLAARALRVPRGLDAALAVGFQGADRRVDLACADGIVFTTMAGIGVDAAVVSGTPEWLKQRVGWPAYAAASAAQLLAAPVEFTVRLDGEPALALRARCVVVGNTGQLPGGFPIMPDAQPDDGVLDVGILAPESLADWASIGYRAITGSRRDDSRLERYRARRVQIHAARVLPRQVDGEVSGCGHTLSVAVMPGALLVRVPHSSHRAGLPGAGRIAT
jgi:diacylglycerol kinase family enzyme